MSDTLQVYANVPTLNDRASKKKQRAWKFYGGGQPVPIQVTTADGTTLVGLREHIDKIDEAWIDAQRLWWASLYDMSVTGFRQFRDVQDEIATIYSVPHHGRIAHVDVHNPPSAIVRVGAGEAKIIEAPVIRLATSGNEERPKKPLEWASQVYIKSLKSLRDSGLHMIEADGVEATPSDIATNNHLGSKIRFDALLEWLLEDKTHASDYVLQELDQATDSWRDGLVHAALDTYYDSDADRDRLADLLLTIAAERRQDTDASAASVTRAAILRAGSLLDSSEINRLRPFLSESKSNLVALVAMLRIVSNDPPKAFNHDELIQDLRNTVSRYSDPVTYRRGDIDAALFNALELLAIYSPEVFGESLDDLARLNKSYLFEQLHEELVEIQNSWQDVMYLEAGQNLVQAIERVHQRMD